MNFGLSKDEEFLQCRPLKSVSLISAIGRMYENKQHRIAVSSYLNNIRSRYQVISATSDRFVKLSQHLIAVSSYLNNIGSPCQVISTTSDSCVKLFQQYQIAVSSYLSNIGSLVKLSQQHRIAVSNYLNNIGSLCQVISTKSDRCVKLCQQLWIAVSSYFNSSAVSHSFKSLNLMQRNPLKFLILGISVALLWNCLAFFSLSCQRMLVTSCKRLTFRH
jgi:hypothetical protein